MENFKEERMQQAQIKPTKAFSQFKLTNNLLQNLNKFNLSPTSKLVLMYLSSCYNPKHADIFPKQKTIASKLGISERSVVRGISELVKEGLIIIECKYSNHYKFTSKIVSYCPVNMSDDVRQDDIKQDDKLALHEPKKEPNKKPLAVEDYKILKAYAIKNGARNIQAYINKLISSGSAKDIIKDAKAIENRIKFEQKRHDEFMVELKYSQENCAPPPATALARVAKIKSNLKGCHTM